MALDGLKLDGVGGVVETGDDKVAIALGMSVRSMHELEREILNIEHDPDRDVRIKIANILVRHLTHEERMCALAMFYDANTAPCAGKRLCQLKKRVVKKLRALPEVELQSLWHLL